MIAREIAGAEHLERVVRERRRHVRTVRSAARSRNRPRGQLALILLAILALVAVLCARVDAAPDDDDDSDPRAGWSDPAPAPDLELTSRVAPPPLPSSADLQRAAAALPPVSAVVAAAYRAAGLADDPAPGWSRRTRLAALVPWIAIRDGRDASWRDVSDPTIGYVTVIDVRATWHFDRLVFDPNELRIAAIDTSRRREKRRVAMLAIRGYYAWLRARAAAATDARWAIQADQAFAELDVLTAGWLAGTVDKARDPR